MKTKKILTTIITLCIFSSALFSQTLPSYVPTDSLLGWWGFTGNANDESGNGNNGVVNGASLAADRHSNPNSAYSFNGTTDYIEVADAPSLRLNNTDFTFSYWVKIDTFTTPVTAFIIKRAIGNYNGWLLVANGSFNNRLQLKTSQGTDPSVESDSTLSEGVWHHVVLVYNQSSTIDFYFDGILSSSHSSGGLSFNANCTAVMRFGHDTQTAPGSYFLNGSMDDIGIWNRALTAQEISNLYSETTTSVNQLGATYFEFYPNPINDVIYIYTNATVAGTLMRITDISGKTIKTEYIKESHLIDVSVLQSGLYFLQIGDRNPNTRKFVKQ
jgi:hypothetical protein